VVAVRGHGRMRDALVIAVGRSNMQVAFTTPTAVREAAERSGPNAEPPHTRGTVKPDKVFNHRPATRQAGTPAAPAATTKEGTMATTAKKDSTKKASTPKAKKPQLTLAQVEAEMADTKDAFDAYYVAYYAEPRDEAGMAANKAGKSTYWRHYNDPRVKAKRDKARDAKKAKAEKAAAKKAPAKAKEAPVAEAPAEVTEGQDPSEA